MPNRNIFCNSPWYELHIYWDGSLGICCQEDHRLHSDDQKYNIANMTIAEWFNSDPVKQFRKSILGDQHLSACSRCYIEEEHGLSSRRVRSNQKSVIFTQTAFDESFKQSPNVRHFNQSGFSSTLPNDIHVDLGNYCNLACKMCSSQASSTIASQEVKWGIEKSRQYLGNDWTKNLEAWNNFKQQLIEIPNLNNIHFMGGETLLTNRFEDLVDFLIVNQRFDVCLSFVTNGTTFNSRLLDKLKKFRRVGIEISIETVDEHNAYQRQGTNTPKVLENIKKYQQWCNGDSITVSLCPAPTLLTVGYLPGLFQFAIDNQLIVKSNYCIDPKFLSIEVLPLSIKHQYRLLYLEFLAKLEHVNFTKDLNVSDPSNYQMVVKEQALTCLSMLSTTEIVDQEQQLELMVRHCEKWDKVYGYDARQLYPEFVEIFERYNYCV